MPIDQSDQFVSRPAGGLRVSDRCATWRQTALESLQRGRMSSYVHPAGLSHERLDATPTALAAASVDCNDLNTSMHGHSQHAQRQHEEVDAELVREVFTAFIQPQVDVNQIMGEEVSEGTLEMLNNLMLIVNNEVTRFKVN